MSMVTAILLRDEKGRVMKGNPNPRKGTLMSNRVRGRKHVHECQVCGKTRMLTYGQMWNIKTGNCSGICNVCSLHMRKPNLGSFRKGRSTWNKGGTMSESSKNKYRESMRGKYRIGKFNPAWKGGITPTNTKIRNSNEYILWRKSVFERDNYNCIWCGQHGGKLHADHIKPFSLFPELRFAIDNGRTLCKLCHLKTDTWGGRSRYA